MLRPVQLLCFLWNRAYNIGKAETSNQTINKLISPSFSFALEYCNNSVYGNTCQAIYMLRCCYFQYTSCSVFVWIACILSGRSCKKKTGKRMRNEASTTKDALAVICESKPQKRFKWWDVKLLITKSVWQVRFHYFCLYHRYFTGGGGVSINRYNYFRVGSFRLLFGVTYQKDERAKSIAKLTGARKIITSFARKILYTIRRQQSLTLFFLQFQ